MFKKLKKKFIIINMSLLTLVFLCIFGVIYFASWNNSRKQVDFTLNSLIHEPPNKRKIGGANPNYTGHFIGITIDLDEDNNVTEVICPYDSSKDIFISSASQILALDKNSGVTDINNVSYAYLKTTIPTNKIVLVDRTNHIYNLRNLLKTFIVTGTLSLLLLFLVSCYFASKSIEPIVEVFDKQKQFIADASHELRTPLAIIKTNLSLITGNKTSTVLSQKKWLNYVNEQTDRMSHLIDDMLSLAKLDSNEHITSLVPINLNKLLENLLMSFEAVFFENQITLIDNFLHNINIYGDLEEIKKLFNILIDNAIKHTPPGGKIIVTINKLKNKSEISITNSGEGIPPEELEKIFERFYRPDNSRQRKSGGYGLGLAIASTIVSNHEGKIYAKSTLGKDTSFIVELPIRD